MLKKKFNIIIIGAGLVGMSLALKLASKKINVCIIEKNGFSKNTGNYDQRTTAISQGSTRIFEEIGIWKILKKKSQPIRKIIVSNNISNNEIDFDADILDEGDLGFIIENKFFKETLLKEIKNNSFVMLKDKTNVKNITLPDNKTDQKIKVSTENGVTYCNLLIGADGRLSKTRFFAEIKNYFHDYKQNAYIFNIEHQEPHNSVALERFFPTGPLALLPMKSKNNHKSSVVWTVDSDHGDFTEISSMEFRYEFELRYKDFFGKLIKIDKPTKYPLNIYASYNYFQNRLVLVGDACQAIHPIAGQGFNLGIRDVACLAKIISENSELGIDPGNKSILREYSRLRLIDKSLLIHVTHGLNKFFSSKLRFVQNIHSLGISLFNKSSFLKKQSMLYAMGLKSFET